MGLDSTAVRFILSAMDLGMKVDSVCTLGHQSNYAKPSEVAALLAEYKRCPPDFWDVYPWRAAVPVADSIFQILGSSRIDSMDNSAFEGATVVHDLNKPVPPSLHDQYDLVLDGGTLEHVFMFPTALESMMRMVKPGGDLMAVTPANGLCGHGFYQFSPELYFRVLNPTYGFELLRLYIADEGKCYHVVDPLKIHGRVELRRGSVNMLVHARKIGAFAGFAAAPPHQSDYLTQWTSHEQTQPRADGWFKGLLRKRLSAGLIERISQHLNRLRAQRAVWHWRRSALLSNRRFFVPVEQWNVRTRDVTGSPEAHP